MDIIEELLEKPYWIIDILPKQVPRLSPGQYGIVEQYYLSDSSLRQKQFSILLKLNCYYDIALQSETRQIRNPEPEHLKAIVRTEYLIILVGEALIILDPTDTYLTVYNADHDLLELIRQLAIAEGLFVWQP